MTVSSRRDAEALKAFTPGEMRRLRALKTPQGIQRFLDAMPYHLANSSWSPRRVLREGTSHCLEGATFAAAALRALGFPALVFDLESDNDTDHVIAIYQVRGHWGAIAKSNFTSCRDRLPIYRSLRELALSYFHTYFNLRYERTLRRYSQPVNLARFDHLDWMTSEKNIWCVAEYLCEIPHRPLLTPAMEKNLYRVDARTRQAEMLGHRAKDGPHAKSGKTAVAARNS
jgi:hypothetical protein